MSDKETDRRYDDALSFLYGQLPMFSRVGAAAYKPGLDTSLELDRWFGHPHRRFKSIHVGGTNGKGSTSHSIAAVLQSQGYKVGLYTSPHLVDFRERMRVNGEMIDKESVVRFVEEWRKGVYEGHPSFFELTMMMAFDWFAREEVDYAVIEVGMGGRLDSTNIITPIGCVITNISNDHTQFLGDTLPAIAAEKAGIIKPGIPVVTGEAEGDVRRVFEERLLETGAPGVFAEDNPLLASCTPCPEGGWECTWRDGAFRYPFGGDYQVKNIETVLHAVEMLRGAGVRIDADSVTKGLSEADRLTGLRGRWEILSTSPLTIADTGHNVAGIGYNMAQLSRLLAGRPGGRLRMVIGFVADKALDKILPLLPLEADYYLTNAQIPRALPVTSLLDMADAAGLRATAYGTVPEAYAAAVCDAGPDDIVYVGGSTFIVADLLASL